MSCLNVTYIAILFAVAGILTKGGKNEKENNICRNPDCHRYLLGVMLLWLSNTSHGGQSNNLIQPRGPE